MVRFPNETSRYNLYASTSIHIAQQDHVMQSANAVLINAIPKTNYFLTT